MVPENATLIVRLVSQQRPPSFLHAQQLVFPLAALLETA